MTGVNATIGETGRLRRYVCAECDLEFTNRQGLRNHIVRVHNTKFHCDKCECVYGYASNLYRHKSSVHADVNTAVSSTTTVNPSIHDPTTGAASSMSNPGVSITTDPKPERKRSAPPSKVEPPTKKTNIITDINTTSGQSASNTVGSHVCLQCRRVYKNKKLLNEHMDVKHGNKFYEYNQCESMFTYATSLNRHKRTVHTQSTTTPSTASRER